MHRCGSFRIRCLVFTLVTLVLLGTMAVAQSTGGRILGKITDPSGAVIPGTTVTLTNEATGVVNSTDADKDGNYGFPNVPVGDYAVQYVASGFKENLLHHVTVTLNQVLTLNQTMQLGQKQEVVDVTSEAPIVDTTSTQLGAVMDERSVKELPLNTRDTYQLLQLQPGVMSNVGGSNSVAYGSDQAGVVSVNGGRGRSNNFNVNGGDANDLFANLPTVQPNPDSIEEFRVLTNTFDAEYGRNSGAVINVVTKSGTNSWHGSTYEFFRNKVLNAQGYFNTFKPDFQQNQFGGTLGGPIKKDRTFFFMSYEGRRIKQGTPTDQSAVPDSAMRSGDFSALLDPVNMPQFTGNVNGTPGNSLIATTLNQRCGLAIQGGEAWSSVFPGGVVPQGCLDPTAVALTNLYVPLPNQPGGYYQSAPPQKTRGDQGSFKFDHRLTNNQNFGFYYYVDDSQVDQALSFFQAAGANVPGFGATIPTRVQQYNLSHTWTLSNTVVNEARFTYMREGQLGFEHPARTNLVQDSCGSLIPSTNCFADPNFPGLGITPGLGANAEGVPFIAVSGSFAIGNNFEGQLPQVGNSFTWSDNISKVLGNHTMKFGVDVRRMRFDQTLYYNVNGYYQYYSDSTTTGVPLADWFLGLPAAYSQGSAQRENVRSTALYLFAQDSWKIKPNLTLNYGLRWELDTPLADQLHHVQTFRPGQSTTVYPCTDCGPDNQYFPTGLVFPGDKGVPAGMTQTYYKAFAPRIGIAYSPGASDGFMKTLFGGAGRSSIRAGYGVFYNPIEQLVLEQFGAEPPFGVSNYLYDTMFNTPYVDTAGNTYPNPANGILSPKPGTAIDWSAFRPILLYGDMQPHLRTQYSEQYNLTIEREIGKSAVLQLGYVGSQGHRLLVTHDLNSGNPQTCLDLNATLGDGTCVQYSEDYSYFVPPGTTIAPQGLHLPYNPGGGSTFIQGGTVVGPNGITLVGLRPYSSPNCHPMTGIGCPSDGVPVFTSIFAQDTVGNSNYNSFQAMLQKRYSRGLQFQLAYTWSKSFDEGSTFEGIVNPIDTKRSYSLSLFDARHRFVGSYDYELPFGQHGGFASKVLGGWMTSGIFTYQTGFPLRITDQNDNELFGSFDFETVGQPNQVAPFQSWDPRTHGGYYFNNNDGAIFSDTSVALGTVGNARRTICCGPGIVEWDMTLVKNTKFSERWDTQFRAEFFNLFNHTNFYNPDGNITDGTGAGGDFGRIKSSRDPRLIQFAFKVSF